MKATAKAHTNIALIKYWGKRDEALILPMNNSLSLTLDAFYTETTVTFINDLLEDQFYLDNEMIVGDQFTKVTKFLDLIREYANTPNLFAEVHSTNAVPTAAGFASSASGFAALAAAATRALDLNIDQQVLSRLTRQGSGSACRSVYGGFVEWEKGELDDGSDSYAKPVAPQDHWDVRIAAVVLSSKMKKVSSREGMRRTAETSPFYSSWVETIPTDLAQIKAAIHDRNFEKMGEIAEANCQKMHATTLAANPPFTYWHDTTLTVMQTVQALCAKGIPAYFTIDAGPNVKVLYQPENEKVIKQTLQEIPGVTNVILSRTGQGVTYK